MWDYLKSLFFLSEQEKAILTQMRKWPEGSFRVSEKGAIFIDPKLVNQLPETIKARELAKKIVEGH